MNTSLTLFGILFSFALQSQPVTSVSPILLDTGIRIEKFDFARDITGELQFEALHTLGWTSMTWEQEVKLKSWQRQWFRFQLKNESADTFDAVLVLPGASWISVYSTQDDSIPEKRAGGFVNFEKRPFPLLAKAVPVEIPGGMAKKYWVGLTTYENKKVYPVDIKLKKAEIVLAELQQRRANLPIHKGHYLAIFTLIAVIFSILFFTTRDRATGWYALYVWGIFLFYLRNYEWRPGAPILLARYGDWHLHIEIILTWAIFIAYTGFVRYFLDIHEKNPRIDNYLKVVMIAFAVFIPIELLFFVALGLKEAFILFTVLKITSFGMFVLILLTGIGKLKSRFAYFILFGMCFLIAPALFTMVTQHIFSSKIHYVIDEVWHVAEIGAHRYPMYAMKLGVVLELLCLSFAIGYKLRLEKEERHKNAYVLQTLQLQYQKTEQELRQQENLNKIILDGLGDKQLSKLLSDVIAAIEKNLADPLFGVEQLAEQVHISRAQLHRKVVEETGVAPSQLLLHTRLRKAVELLKTTRLSVTEIAEETGFSEAGYFSKVFKKEVGCTPSEVRAGAGGGSGQTH